VTETPSNTTPWTPLSRRTSGVRETQPVEGAPEWLYPRLQEWLYKVLQHTDEPVQTLRPGRELSDDTREVMLRLQMNTPPWLLPGDDPAFLDALDATIRWVKWGRWITRSGYGPRDPWGSPATLEEILKAANSAWRVNSDWRGLERRVSLTATNAVSKTIHDSGADAAGHLAAAWDAMYGRHPDADKAYAESVKAVEAVACPSVLPTNATATLGRVRDRLRDTPNHWQLILPGRDGNPGPVEPMVAMITALWEGQRSRHAGTPTARRQDAGEAEAALYLACTLVQWLSSGVLQVKLLD
jgi:hypothetical protein